MTQEEIQKEAKRYARGLGSNNDEKAFIAGVKLCMSEMYSKEDLKNAFFDGIRITGEGYNGEYSGGNDPDIEVEFYESYTEWFNKFKKK